MQLFLIGVKIYMKVHTSWVKMLEIMGMENGYEVNLDLLEIHIPAHAAHKDIHVARRQTERTGKEGQWVIYQQGIRSRSNKPLLARRLLIGSLGASSSAAFPAP